MAKRCNGRAAAAVAVMVEFLSSGAAPGWADDARQRLSTAPDTAAAQVPSGLPDAITSRIVPQRFRLEGRRVVVPLAKGGKALLTVDADLQDFVQRYLRQYQVPEAGVVALDPSTGRVLAYVSHTWPNAVSSVDRARDASPPAASIFKLVTAAALLENGVQPGEKACFSGGAGGIEETHLRGGRIKHQRCASLADAVGESLNVVFAKLTLLHLSSATLSGYATRFGFAAALPSDVPAQAGAADIPAAGLDLARTAAGFWHTHLSPLHGALLAATIANDGNMPHADLVDEVRDRQGVTVYRRAPRPATHIISAATAQSLTAMMQLTVRKGTSRQAFHDARGRPLLPKVEVAGKTGSLSSRDPYRDYSWWVGFATATSAPNEATQLTSTATPRLALGILLINGPLWRIKASHVACALLRHFLRRSKAPGEPRNA